jgi:Cu(I)/Ag(I) efflux system membrane fusion protein
MDMDLVPVCEGELAAEGAPVVTIRPEVIHNLGIRTYRVEASARPRQVIADGYLLREAGAWRVLVDIIARDADWVRAGLPAEVRLLNIPGRTWRARVERVEPDIQVGVRSVKAVVRLAQADPAFREGLFAEVTIQAPPADSKLFVPREALIRTARRTAVVLALGESRFQPVEVVPGEEYGEWVEILRGLEEGDTVVTSGQFLIDSEASLRASLLRMEAREGPAAADAAVGYGVVRAVDAGARRIRLDHEPIAALGWPKMVMDFRVAAPVDLKGVGEGSHVRFELRREPDPDGMYVITAIEPAKRH